MAIRVKTAPWLLLQLAIQRVEGVTLIALVVCLVGASLQWLALPQIERRGRAAHDVLSSTPPDNQGLDDEAVQAERYQAFQDRLAENGDRGTLLKLVFAEAAAAGISLPQGDYSVAADADGHYNKLQIILPVKGSYQQVRTFAGTLLRKLPALSLDEITFRRETIKSPSVEARLRLTLYVKDEQ